MDIPYWILAGSTLIEVLLLLLAAVFFVKLKKSESLMRTLQDRQQEFLRKLDFNARLGLKKSFIGIIRAVFQSGDQRFAYAFAVFFVFRCCRIVDDAADSIFEGGILSFVGRD